jgi:putative transposase
MVRALRGRWETPICKKGKRYTTEDKIRILREVDGGKTVLDICRERNIAAQTFDRWKRVFGMMEVSEARRLKELERENTELKEELLKNRVLSYVCEKKL